jgi:hypothetical protein
VQVDPVGFGLENFDRLGRWRSTELDAAGQPTACTISGVGDIIGVGTFVGAAELGDMLLKDDRLETCMAKQYLRFSQGRLLMAEEQPLLDGVVSKYKEQSRTLQAVVLAYVASPDFVLSRADGVSP